MPVYIAAEGPAMLRVAGGLGDAVILQAKPMPYVFEAAASVIRGGAQIRGRDPSSIRLVSRLDIAIGQQPKEAYQLLRHRVVRRLIAEAPAFDSAQRFGIHLPDELRSAISDIGYTNDRPTLECLGRLVPDELVDFFCIAATRTTLADRLATLAADTTDNFIFNPIAASDEVDAVIDAIGDWRKHALRATPGE
jgi:alkanesulfonate monooxygenase SsuD/methylene tetrahydromethanopterin reductase-like flavin-dependent oxidoreductase (luciferase family)